MEMIIESEEDKIRRSVQLYVESLMTQVCPEHEFEDEEDNVAVEVDAAAEVINNNDVDDS